MHIAYGLGSIDTMMNLSEKLHALEYHVNNQQYALKDVLKGVERWLSS